MGGADGGVCGEGVGKLINVGNKKPRADEPAAFLLSESFCYGTIVTFAMPPCMVANSVLASLSTS